MVSPKNYSQRTRLKVGVVLAAMAVLIGLSLMLWPTQQRQQMAAASASFAFSEIGARATANYEGKALGVTANAEGAELRTEFQKLKAEVNSSGLSLESTEKSGGRLRLRATAVGRETGNEVRLPATGEVNVREKVVAFHRPGLTEEFSVSVDGVRQDFLLAERPAGEGELFVELALRGAKAQSAAAGARLRLAGSGRELAYDRLRVTDATGRELRARLEVVTAEHLNVRVTDAEAVYPVRIDPTFSDADWVGLNPGFPGASGSVAAMAVDGDGNLYAGGSFRFIGTVPLNYIAKWNGSVWSALGSGMDSRVNALAVSGSDLYAGGIFTTAGGVSANGIAKWNGSSWSALGSGVTNGFASTVNALAVIGSDLYAGGPFTTAGGVTANGIAKWDGSAWSALGSGMGNGGSVGALAVIGSNLYVGGGFTTAGGVAANNIARWNGSAWANLGTGTDLAVGALAVSGTNLFVGGAFSKAGNMTVNCIARWNGSAWSALDSGLNNTVYTLAVSGSDLYAGGDFTGGSGIGASRIAKWNGSAWSDVGSGADRTVRALAVIGSDLYAGGDFNTTGNVAAKCIAKWNGSAWSAFGSALNGTVSALAVIGSDLYVGGDFTSAVGIPASRIAKWNGSVWSALGSGANSNVNVLAVIGSDLYAGGFFSSAGGVPVGGIAKWNGTTWSSLGSGVAGSVDALAVSGSDLYAGGGFTTAGGVSANRIAKWNGSAWSALGSGMNSNVNALAVSGGDLYAGGSFTTAGGVAASNIAKWNGSAWSPLGSGVNSSPRALAAIGSDLYAAGGFTTAGGVSANRIAKWNGSAWSSLGSGMDGTVNALAVSGGDLYAGGGFTTAGGVSANRIAKWDGSAWSALGSGTDGAVLALATDSSGHLFVAGLFNFAGTTLSPYLAQYNLSINTSPVITTTGFSPLLRQQGAAASNATIASVSDTETASGSLTVTATTVPTGISVTNIVNTNGTVTADVAASCSAAFGDHTVVLQVSDGSLTATANLTVTVADTTAPTLGACPTNIVNQSADANCMAAVTFTPPTASDNCGTPIVTCTPASGSSFALGTTTVSCVAVDAVNNMSVPCAFTVQVVDTTAPTPGACPANIVNQSADANCMAAVSFTPPTASDNCGTATVTCTPASGSSFALGTTTVSCTATDAANNTSAACTFTVQVVDTTAPTLAACPTNITQAPTAGACGAVVNFSNPSATDNCGTPTVMCTPASGTNFSIGTTTVTCSATDAANNQSTTCSFTVTVTTSTPPVLSYSSPQMAVPGQSLVINPATGPNDGEGISSIVVQNVAMPSAPTPVSVSVDNTTGVVTVPSNMPVGSYTVTIRATDNCGAFTDATFTLNVGCLAITVNPSSLPNGFVGSSYNQALSATGGTPGYTFALDSGAFPPGLGIVGSNLTGTPTATGVFNFTIKATDSSSICFGTRAYTVVISGTGLQFYPLAHPVRLLDTRIGWPACQAPGTQINGGNPLTVPARGTCGGLTIPANAAAVTGNVTTVGPVANGFLTIYPSGSAQPSASNSNYQTGQTLNNVFTVGLGAADGAFKVYSAQTTDVIVDITGYFAPPGTGGLYFHPLPAPVRLLDTRAMQPACTTPGAPLLAGTELLQQGNAVCGIPGSAVALVGNAITVGPAAQGFLTLFPSNETRPLIASGNYQAGQTLNSPFTVKLAPSGNFTIYSVQQTDLVVDVLGYYSVEASDATGIGLLFSPLTSTRLVDTRPMQPACFMPGIAIPATTDTAQSARGVCGIPATAKAIVGNATTVGPAAQGFLTFWPSDVTRPNAVTSNFAAGVNFNRHFTVGLGTDGEFKIYALTSTHLVIDVSGSFAP